MTVKFGTDGWRAVISEEFTFANLRLVAPVSYTHLDVYKRQTRA